MFTSQQLTPVPSQANYLSPTQGKPLPYRWAVLLRHSTDKFSSTLLFLLLRGIGISMAIKADLVARLFSHTPPPPRPYLWSYITAVKWDGPAAEGEDQSGCTEGCANAEARSRGNSGAQVPRKDFSLRSQVVKDIANTGLWYFLLMCNGVLMGPHALPKSCHLWASERASQPFSPSVPVKTSTFKSKRSPEHNQRSIHARTAHVLQMPSLWWELASLASVPASFLPRRCSPYVSQHGLYLRSEQTQTYKLAITVSLMLLLFIISYSNTHSTTGGKEYSLVIKVMKYSFMLPFQHGHKWGSQRLMSASTLILLWWQTGTSAISTPYDNTGRDGGWGGLTTRLTDSSYY